MEPTVRLRARSAQVLGAAMMVVAVAGVLSALVAGGDTILRFAAPMALFGVLGWGAFWRPYVEVSDGGITVANTLRTVEIPWPAVEEVDGRYGLRLRTAYGPVSAWGASAPAGRDRARGGQSEAATAVNQRLEALRAAGHLDDATLERPTPRTVWHLPLLAVLVTLAVASLVGPLAA
jgi:hypothetical protein